MEFKIKNEDFIVKEVCNLKFKENGRYGYFLLKKTGYTTYKAVDLISKVLKVSREKVNYSGLKDKKSVSEQYISVYGYNKGEFEWKNNGLYIKFMGYGDERINLGFCEFNSFTIIVRDLSEKIKIKCGILENYFDEQRFSLNNVEIGRNLIKRNFKEICLKLNLSVKSNDFIGALRSLDKKLLKLYLHSYQSYLFNLVLKEYIRLNFESYNKNGFLFTKLDKIIDLKIPLINFDTKFDKIVEKLYLNILEIEKIEKKDFLIREMPELISLGVERRAFVNVKDLSYEYSDDELGKLKCVLKFILPKGSYATILIKKVF